MIETLPADALGHIDRWTHAAEAGVPPQDDAEFRPAPDGAPVAMLKAGIHPQVPSQSRRTESRPRCLNPRSPRTPPPRSSAATVCFLGAVTLWNIVTLWLLDVTVFERVTLGMGLLASMFAVMVLCKIVRDRAEAQELVNEVRAARYEEMLAGSPAPGLGEL